MYIDNTTQQLSAHQNKESEDNTKRPSRNELVIMLSDMIKAYDNVPPNGMIQPVTHYDLCSSLMLVLSIFRADD